MNESKNPIATIEMNSGNRIVIELYPEIAPNTVNNFIFLINKGYYDGTVFQRVIPDFMIQGGCPFKTCKGSPGYLIKGECTANGHPNPLKHVRGIVSSSRRGEYDSNESQFFIVIKDTPRLDGEYAAFGRVLEGMEEVDRISLVPRNKENNKPYEDQEMVRVTVDTFGVEYPRPETLPDPMVPPYREW